VTLLVAALAIAATVLAAALWRVRARLRAAQEQRSSLEAERIALERAQAAAAERERIYNDLHDDIGAKLLNLIYLAEKPAQADLARSVLQDLRDVVTRSRGEPGTLLDVLSDIQAETEQRLAALGVELDWEQDELPDPPMDHGQALHLYRIVREALTNALRHARPGRIRIRSRRQGDSLLLDVTDLGGAAAPVEPGSGRGTAAMQERAAELRGSIAWTAGTEGGTKVVLQFPLPGNPG
jgi:signal transduction histidine kinase